MSVCDGKDTLTLPYLKGREIKKGLDDIYALVEDHEKQKTVLTEKSENLTKSIEIMKAKIEEENKQQETLISR